MKDVVGVYLGDFAVFVGELTFVADRGKETCQFAYATSWLESPNRFQLDPALPLVSGHQFPKGQEVFFGCFEDCAPDGWGKMVINRDRKKRGVTAPPTSLDMLLEVHDGSRIGALRFSTDGGKTFLADPGPGARKAPPLIELKDLLRAATAVDKDSETAADLRLLLHRGSPLGGMRPKCTILDDDGSLALGKFPSATDDKRDIVRGEVLALTLAGMAGINVSHARVVIADKKPVAVIRRFDRTGSGRLMYVSARTLIGATGEEGSYTELADAIRGTGASPDADIEDLWRRIVFSVLISNVDDHLNNHGFLHQGNGWRLSPAFDMNPAPGKERNLKTWITQDTGPAATIEAAMSAIKPFGISLARARQILAKVDAAVGQWKDQAAKLGMTTSDIRTFANAFEHPERQVAREEIARRVASDRR